MSAAALKPSAVTMHGHSSEILVSRVFVIRKTSLGTVSKTLAGGYIEIYKLEYPVIVKEWGKIPNNESLLSLKIEAGFYSHEPILFSWLLSRDVVGIVSDRISEYS